MLLNPHIHTTHRAITLSDPLFLVTCFLVFVLFILQPSGCSRKVEERTPGDSFYLSPDDVKKLSKQGETGDANAAFRLWQYYELNAYDDEQAHYWLRKAAQHSHAIAQYNIGIELLHDEKLEAKKEGVYWLTKAGEKGEGQAYYEIASAYAEGYLGPADLVLARRCLHQGAKIGNRMCWKKLAVYLFEGIGGPTDYPSAYYWISLEALCAHPHSVGGKETWTLRNKIASHLSVAELEQQWNCIDKYIAKVRSGEIMVDVAPFLEGMIPRVQSIEGREIAEKEDKIHRKQLRQKVR